jgi:hypothetical protein
MKHLFQRFKTSSYFIPSVVGSVVIIVLFYTALHTHHSPATTTQLIPYFTEKYSLTFKYPETYSLQKVASKQKGVLELYVISSKDHGETPQGGEGYPSITITIYDNSKANYDIVRWLKESSDANFNLSDGTFNKATVAGKEAVFYKHDGLYNNQVVAFIHNKTIIVISGAYLNLSDPIVTDFFTVVNTVKVN